MWKIATAILAATGIQAAEVYKTPAMGYIASTSQHCWVQSGVLKVQADYMAHLGLIKKGYNTFVVDDCW